MTARIEADIDDEGNVSVAYEGQIYLLCALARRIQIDADNMLMEATEDIDDDEGEDDNFKVGFTN
jgi:hypothetical protein